MIPINSRFSYTTYDYGNEDYISFVWMNSKGKPIYRNGCEYFGGAERVLRFQDILIARFWKFIGNG
jgi:hypothetical protein